ncbi:MAG: hypothetical protein ACLQPD_01785 [Desulfomonilaceae bacterium]
MKTSFAVALLTLIMICSTSASAQVVEMAAKCDQIQKDLAEVIKRPDTTDAKKIKEALGLDILNSCDKGEGQIICYQCLDKDQNLRTVQLLQDRNTKKFSLLGFGCRCKD